MHNDWVTYALIDKKREIVNQSVLPVAKVSGLEIDTLMKNSVLSFKNVKLPKRGGLF